MTSAGPAPPGSPPGGGPGGGVRPLAGSDVPAAARLHRAVLHAQFISRLGLPFLEVYYRAWADAEAGVALAATDPAGALEGLLLGALDPAAHTAAMVRRHGPTLAARLAVAAARDPRLAGDLVATRAGRYAHGLVSIARHLPPQPAPDGSARGGTGEITHLLVAPGARGRGVGRSLLAAAEAAAAAAGLHDLVLVTPVDDEHARRFYDRLGWCADGDVTSRSGERYVRFRRPVALNPPPGGPTPPGAPGRSPPAGC